MADVLEIPAKVRRQMKADIERLLGLREYKEELWKWIAELYILHSQGR